MSLLVAKPCQLAAVVVKEGHLTPGNTFGEKSAVADKSKAKTNGGVYASMTIDSDSDRD
jgi:hypothetical protein